MECGCIKTLKYSRSKKDSRIIFLGGINHSWVNQELLINISRLSPLPIDIYSYEPFSTKLFPHLNSKGYLKDLDLISEYQLGLITISPDPIRANGFSAKHLMYFNYGLPVLCPEWRRDKLLEPATIYYNQNNFAKQVLKYSRSKFWSQKHLAALRIAHSLQWSETLKPLLSQINQLQSAKK